MCVLMDETIQTSMGVLMDEIAQTSMDVFNG
jgi:hypothetical protein